MSDEKQNSKKKAAENAVEKRPFFFPTIEQGVTVHATSQEEANAIVKERYGL